MNEEREIMLIVKELGKINPDLDESQWDYIEDLEEDFEEDFEYYG